METPVAIISVYEAEGDPPSFLCDAIAARPPQADRQPPKSILTMSGTGHANLHGGCVGKSLSRVLST